MTKQPAKAYPKLWSGQVTPERTQAQMTELARIMEGKTEAELRLLWEDEERLAREREPHALARWDYRYLQAMANKDYKDAAEAKAWAMGYFIHAANLRDMSESEFKRRWKTKSQREGAWIP